jgi:hypothetical protein
VLSEGLLGLEADPGNRRNLESLMRAAHSIKGANGTRPRPPVPVNVVAGPHAGNGEMGARPGAKLEGKPNGREESALGLASHAA